MRVIRFTVAAAAAVDVDTGLTGERQDSRWSSRRKEEGGKIAAAADLAAGISASTAARNLRGWQPSSPRRGHGTATRPRAVPAGRAGRARRPVLRRTWR